MSFYSALNGVADLINHCIIGGVVERFCDATNTFHLLLGDIIINLFRFCYANRPWVNLELLVYQEDFHSYHDQLLDIFSPIIE